MESPARLGLTADRDYKIGEVIVRLQPFVQISEGKTKYCDRCLSPPTRKKRLLKCIKCRKFYYCSKRCQLSDWAAGHKYKECLLYRADQRSALMDRTTLFRCALRVYMRTLAEPDFITKKVTTIDGQQVSFMDLPEYEDLMQAMSSWKLQFLYDCTDGSSVEARQLKTYIQSKLKDGEPLWNSTIFQQILSRVYEGCLTKGTSPRQAGSRSVVLLEFPSPMSTSDDSNVCVQDDGTACVVKSTRRLTKGEKLSIESNENLHARISRTWLIKECFIDELMREQRLLDILVRLSLVSQLSSDDDSD